MLGYGVFGTDDHSEREDGLETLAAALAKIALDAETKAARYGRNATTLLKITEDRR